MTQSEFREVVLIEVRKFLPEVPSWDDMARFVRVAGQSVESPDNLNYNTAMTTVERNAFIRYASITEAIKDQFVINKPKTSEYINIDNYHILYVDDLAYAEGLNQTEPRVFPPKTTSDLPMWKQRNPFYRRVWFQRGRRVYILPNPDTDITVFVRGVIYPHYASGELVGCIPGDEYSLAKYVASEFLEPFNFQVAQLWRNECITEWVLQKQKQAWFSRYKGRNMTRTVI